MRTPVCSVSELWRLHPKLTLIQTLLSPSPKGVCVRPWVPLGLQTGTPAASLRG